MGPNIWEQGDKLWRILIIVVPLAVLLGEAKYRIWSLGKEHKKLDDKLAQKADIAVCRIVHTEQKESAQVVIDVIHKGNKELREDIKHLTKRLDFHISQNGVV